MPAAQFRQWVEDGAPINDEYLPASQSRHCISEVADEAAEYLPATQAIQVEMALAADSDE